MKRTVQLDFLAMLFLMLTCAVSPFAQPSREPLSKQANPFAFLTIIKLDEVSSKDDLDKVKAVLGNFGYKVHSHKINFERKQVLIRMRQLVTNDTLISAFKKAGYHAWFDENEKILPADSVYRRNK